MRVAAERKLKALQVQLEGTSNKLVERVSQQRYRMVRFFGAHHTVAMYLLANRSGREEKGGA